MVERVVTAEPAGGRPAGRSRDQSDLAHPAVVVDRTRLLQASMDLTELFHFGTYLVKCSDSSGQAWMGSNRPVAASLPTGTAFAQVTYCVRSGDALV